MNVSVEWLDALAPTGRSARELRELLTAHTATVDELIPLRADLAPIVVARVVHAAPHPDSDHLHVTKVDVGGAELLDVVCGAPNVAAGRLYPFAPSGTTMPGGLRIEKRRIRGQTSNGMLCSARELGLGQEHDGILELNLEVPPGTPLLSAMPVGDARLVLDVLPNRPDLLSHLGVARELAAITGAGLHLPAVGTEGIDIPAPRRFRRAGNAGGIVMHLEDASAASRYMGIVIRGVTVAPSPPWLVERLAAVGARSINNVVDASNYVLHELGHPTHAFDLRKLDPDPIAPEKTVVIRSARAGETLVTLDGVTRTLTPEMTIIADSMRPVAIAGVMGGRGTEVDDTTTDLFVEVAVFDASRTRRTRRLAGLSTDASYRFERGVDVVGAPRTLERVASLIISLAGGQVAASPVDLYAGDPPHLPIILRTSRVTRVLGVAIPVEQIASLLQRVGCHADVESGGAAVHVVAPSWRRDLVGEIDLIEEVARLHGFDLLPDELRPYRPGTAPDAPLWALSARLRDTLAGAGLLEVRPVPFVPGGDEHVRLRNPLADTEAHLRRSLLESLARRAEHNLAHMEGNVRLFEVGSVFAPSGHALPREATHVALLVLGERRPPHFTDPRPPVYDAWDIKGLAERVSRVAFPAARVELVPTPDEPVTLWRIDVDGLPRGLVARVALDAPVWAAPAYGVELSLSDVANADVAPPGQHAHAEPEVARTRVAPYVPLPVTPAAEFDLALLVPDGVPAGEVERTIRSSAGDLLERLVVFDLYLGDGVPAGKRSIGWRLTLRHPERTLRDKEIEGRRSRILAALQTELNVRQRTT